MSYSRLRLVLCSQRRIHFKNMTTAVKNTLLKPIEKSYLKLFVLVVFVESHLLGRACSSIDRVCQVLFLRSFKDFCIQIHRVTFLVKNIVQTLTIKRSWAQFSVKFTTLMEKLIE